MSRQGHQWSRRNSHRASSRRGSKKRRRSTRSNSSFGLIDDEDEILQMYGEDGELVEDPEELENPESLLDRIRDQKDLMENVKFQPWPIRKKLQVLSLAKSFVEKHEGHLSRGRGYQQKGQQLLKQMKRSWNNFVSWVTPWEMRIKRIESHFGSVVTSYFIFLRWLIWINVWLTVLQLCFIMIPEMLVGPPYGSMERKTIPASDVFSAYDLKTIWDADGVMRYSPIFYGYYGNANVIGNGYRLPLAYMIVNLISFAYSFIVVLQKMASNSRQSRLSNKDEQFTFSWKLFTDWDYMVGHPETANTKHASIITTMKEAIVEVQEKKQEGNKYLLVLMRILSNVVILIALAISTYIIQLCVDRSRILERAKMEDPNLESGWWAENEMTVVMTLIGFVFPSVLDVVDVMEKYHPRTTLRLVLARIFVFNLINVYTLFIALYDKQNDLKQVTQEKAAAALNATRCVSATLVDSTTAFINGTTVSDLTVSVTEAVTSSSRLSFLYNSTAFPSLGTAMTTTKTTAPTSQSDGFTTATVSLSTQESATSSVNSNCTGNSTTQNLDYCWEDMIGKEVFKLTLMDLIFTVAQIFIQEVFRSIFIKYCNTICCWDLEKTFPEYPDFKTAENILYLINNQGMLWLGVFFSPGLAVLNLLKLLILMYVRCWCVVVCNVPQERIFRASRSNNFYFSLLLIMLFLCMLPPLFAIVGIEPSPTCGPFSGLPRIYSILSKTIVTELPASLNAVLEYAASPGVILPVFMLLGMTIYYLVSTGRSLTDANDDLRRQLEYERTDGRKKVYAMADAKHDLQHGGNKAGHGRMATTVSSVLKATQMAKAINQMSQRGNGDSNHTSGRAVRVHKMAPAVRPKPHVPVAVVQGKQSLKRSAANVMSRAALMHRRQQKQVEERQQMQQGRQHPKRQQQPQRQHHAPPRQSDPAPTVTQKQPIRQQQQRQHHQQRIPGTNGRMTVVGRTSSIGAIPDDITSNEDSDIDDENDYLQSSQSSIHSGYDVTDSTGHLRPLTNDDVHLLVGSDSEDDQEEENEMDPYYQDDDDDDDTHGDDLLNLSIERHRRPSIPPAPIPKEMIKPRQEAARPPVSRSRPSRKPADIPKITVIDFGEEEEVEGSKGGREDPAAQVLRSEEQEEERVERVGDGHRETAVVTIENELNAKNKDLHGTQAAKTSEGLFGAAAKKMTRSQRKDKVADAALAVGPIKSFSTSKDLILTSSASASQPVPNSENPSSRGADPGRGTDKVPSSRGQKTNDKKKVTKAALAFVSKTKPSGTAASSTANSFDTHEANQDAAESDPSNHEQQFEVKEDIPPNAHFASTGKADPDPAAHGQEPGDGSVAVVAVVDVSPEGASQSRDGGADTQITKMADVGGRPDAKSKVKTFGKASKKRFSSILAKFQKLGDG